MSDVPFQPVGVPMSLVAPEASTAAARRAIKDQKANGSAPTAATDGFRTHGAEWLHVLIELPDAGTSLNYTVYVFDRASQKWAIAVASTALAVANSPKWVPVQVYGAERVAVLLNNFAGVFTNGANVWLSDNGRMDNGTGSE